MRTLLAVSLIVMPLGAGWAQDAASFRPFSPISGPNDAIPSPVCDLINFGFCPQPPAPVPPALDPESVAAFPPPRTVVEPLHRGHRRSHRRAMHGQG